VADLPKLNSESEVSSTLSKIQDGQEDSVLERRTQPLSLIQIAKQDAAAERRLRHKKALIMAQMREPTTRP
jgi:hypothetical protein